MPKIKRLTALRIEQIFTIIFFLTFILFVRSNAINSYNRQVDLNIKKTLIISKNNYENRLFENFANKDKDDFSNSIDLLILILLSFLMMFLNVQKRISKEKEYSLLVENPKA